MGSSHTTAEPSEMSPPSIEAKAGQPFLFGEGLQGAGQKHRKHGEGGERHGGVGETQFTCSVTPKSSFVRFKALGGSIWWGGIVLVFLSLSLAIHGFRWREEAVAAEWWRAL